MSDADHEARSWWDCGLRSAGYQAPVLCTPLELMEGISSCNQTQSSKKSVRHGMSTTRDSIMTWMRFAGIYKESRGWEIAE